MSPPDPCITSFLEAALSGNEEQKPLDCTLCPDLSVLADLALGSTKEPSNSLWVNMQDYALSKGLCLGLDSGHLCVPCLSVPYNTSICALSPSILQNIYMYLVLH